MMAQGLFVSSHSEPTGSETVFPTRQMLREILDEPDTALRRRLQDKGVVLPSWVRSVQESD